MKNAKINFTLAMIVTVIIVLGAIFCGVSGAIIGGAVDVTVDELEETRLGDDEIDDVEGYGLIFGYVGAGLGWLGGILLLVAAIMAGIYAVGLFAFALAAWLVYKGNAEKIKAYRILMGFEYALQGILAFNMIKMAFEGSFSAFTFGAGIVLALEIAYSARNTYTERILV